MTALFIKCSPLVRHVLEHEFPDGHLSKGSLIGLYIIGLLSRSAAPYKRRAHRPEGNFKLIISGSCRRRYGRWLGEEKCSELNSYISKVTREKLRQAITTFLMFDPNMLRAIKYAREMFNIPEEVYADDALKRDYIRWRHKSGAGTRIYQKSV